MLRAGSRLPEALRVGETALEMAQRIFPGDHPSLALSYERLGQIHDQQGNHGEAKVLLEKALRIIDAIKPTDPRTIYRLARRLAYLCDVDGQEEEAITHYETAIRAGRQLGNVRHTDLGTMLNNVALIYRRSGRQKAAEPCW